MSSNIVKNTVTKNLVASNARIVIGYITAIICGIIVIIACVNTGLKTDFDVVMTIIFFAFMVCGIWQIVRGKKNKKLIVLFREYAVRLSADPLRSINKLAAATGAAAETVKKNTIKMIRKGYFVNAYIDFDRGCLVFPPESPSIEHKNSPAQLAELSAGYTRISCPGCGAKNKIPKGTVSECEFCGNYLSES